MDLTFIALLLASIAEIFVLVYLARLRSVDLIGMSLHPFNVLGFLFVITILDFLTLYLDVLSGDYAVFAETSISVESDVVNGFQFFVFCQTACIAGLILSAVIMAPNMRPHKQLLASDSARSIDINARIDMSASRICIIGCAIASLFAVGTLLTVALQNGSLNYIAGVRTRFFAENPLLLVIVSTVAPSFILYGSRNKPSAVLKVLPIFLILLSLVGGRSKLLYPLIALAYWYCRRHKVSVIWIYATAPVLMFALAIFSYYSRYSGSYTSYDDYLNQTGGVFNSLFGEASISMAEAITLNINNPILSREPWESILGALMLPFPRSIFEWKPLGVSTDFSMAINYDRFMLVRSEWTVTGFVNLFYDLGYGGALLGCMVLAFCWSSVLYRSVRRRWGTSFVGPILILTAYQFTRGDIYIVSQFLWPTGIVLLVYYTLKSILRSLVR